MGDDLGRVARRQTLLFARRVPAQPVHQEQPGELVPVAGFQNQPNHGWQAIQEDDEDDYQPPPTAFLSASVEEYFEIVRQFIQLIGFADIFPPGEKHRNACTAETSNACGLGWDIRRDEGRQLRTASYAPTQSGAYYLQVTRIRDDQPVYRSAKGWSIFHDYRGDATNYQPVYAASVLSQQGLRNAFTYYEISVEVRGPTLSSVTIDDDHKLQGDHSYWYITNKNQFGFFPGASTTGWACSASCRRLPSP